MFFKRNVLARCTLTKLSVLFAQSTPGLARQVMTQAKQQKPAFCFQQIACPNPNVVHCPSVRVWHNFLLCAFLFVFVSIPHHWANGCRNETNFPLVEVVICRKQDNTRFSLNISTHQNGESPNAAVCPAVFYSSTIRHHLQLHEKQPPC